MPPDCGACEVRRMGSRRRAEVLGPDRPGFLRVRLARPGDEVGAEGHVIAVPIGHLPSALRRPGSRFVARIEGRELEHVETDAWGETWILVQDRVRDVLSRLWDPLGVADISSDEYDHYIEPLVRLCAAGAGVATIADQLDAIVREGMGLVSQRTASETTARALVALDLPALP